MGDPPVPAEIAYYYPEPYWLADEGGWVKSLLLFFDEIAILLPQYMRGRSVIADPTLAGPVEDLGLLRVIEPETFVDDATAAQLAEVIDALAAGSAMNRSRARSVRRIAWRPTSWWRFGAIASVGSVSSGISSSHAGGSVGSSALT